MRNRARLFQIISKAFLDEVPDIELCVLCFKQSNDFADLQDYVSDHLILWYLPAITVIDTIQFAVGQLIKDWEIGCLNSPEYIEIDKIITEIRNENTNHS
jgi:hypothetical protein